MEQLKVSSRQENSENVISIEGNLTLMDALKFRDYLAAEVDNDHNLVIDLNQIDEVDLTGFNVLLSKNILLKKHRKTLKLLIPEDHPIKELLHLTKFKDQFLYAI